MKTKVSGWIGSAVALLFLTGAALICADIWFTAKNQVAPSMFEVWGFLAVATGLGIFLIASMKKADGDPSGSEGSDETKAPP